MEKENNPSNVSTNQKDFHLKWNVRINLTRLVSRHICDLS